LERYSNPLEDFYLYQIACWCCLEEDIISLFEHFKQKHKAKDGDSNALKKLAKRMSGSWCTDNGVNLRKNVNDCV
jgi:hypothetical protein